MNEKINIQIFYHLYITDEWDTFSIFNEQMNILLNSGLLHNCQFLNIGVIHSGNSTETINKINKLIELYNINSNIKILYINNSGNECYTGTHLKEYCDGLDESISENTYILYFHSKGASHINSHKELTTRYWRHYLEHFNILKWRDCIDKLNEGYDSCGILWVKQLGHPLLHESSWKDAGFYAGTFYWVKSSLVRKIPFKYFTNEVFKRECMESIPAIIPHKYYSFDESAHDNGYDLYQHIYNPINYNNQ